MRNDAYWLKYFFVAAVLVIAMTLVAQQIPTAKPQGDQAASPAAKGSSSERNPAPPQNAPANASNATRITVQGCLNGGKQGYTLLQESTGAGFELESQPYQLKNMRGKLVAITGQEMSPGQGSQLPRLQIEKLEVLSDHCVLPGNASGASTAVPQGSRNENNSNGPAPPDATTPKYQSPGAPNQTPPSQGNNPTNWGRTSGAPSPGTGNPPPPATEPPPKQ